MAESSKQNRPHTRSFARMLVFQTLYRRDVNPAEPLSDDAAFFRAELAAIGRESEPAPAAADSDAPDYTQTPAFNAEEPVEADPLSPREQRKLVEFAQDLLDAVLCHREEIDRKIEQAASHWSLGRMAAIDRNILRMAVAELDYFPTPTAIVINEAIELAKRFGEADSGSFVNGVLGKVEKKN